MEQEVAEQARGVVIVPLALAEAEGGLQQGALLGGEALFRDVCLGQPGGQGIRGSRHRSPSRATSQGVVYSVAAES